MEACSLKVYPMRLLPGTEIKSALMDFVRKNNLNAAFLMTCVGSVLKATLRLASETEIITLSEKMEICSLVGTVCKDGAHLHASLGRSDGSTISGHVMGDMEVYTTAEIVLGDAVGTVFTRPFDANTGFTELKVTKST